jgi:hypothetical protein
VRNTVGFTSTCFCLIVSTGAYAQRAEQQVLGTSTTPTYMEFEVPGSGTGLYQGTTADSVNTARTAAGYYLDSSDAAHGFVRAASGTITSFDALGAGTQNGQGTWVYSINSAGTTAGSYGDARYIYHGSSATPAAR